MDSEVYFPRGSIKTTKRKDFPSGVENIFSFPKGDNKSKSGKSRKRKRDLSTSSNNVTKKEESPLATAAEILTYEQIQEGMLILACIRSVTPLAVEVELPGKSGGKIQISNISDHYTKFLQQQIERQDVDEEKDLARLNSIFHVGQFVSTKVLQKTVTPKGTKILLSMNPADIHSDWTHKVLQQNLLVWAAVESESDHGYQLDAGINNCRIFLPYKNLNKGTKLVVGQPLWCVVQKCDVNFSASTAVVSILEKHMKSAMQDIQINLHHLIPGMQIDFKVTKAVKYGLQGKFMKGYCGYVNEGYLATPLEQISKYKQDETVKAYFLYTQPTTKLSYFSLRSLSSVCTYEYAIGTILQSKIVSRAGGGINITLPNKEKGFVSFKRIAGVRSANGNLNDAISDKYPQGSSHQCRILDYQHFEQVYICTFEQSVLKEKFFTTNDAQLGELINVKVKSITKEGLVVQMGKITGFIHNMHLSDVAYSDNIKKKFVVGQTLQARVWSIDNKGVYLTHKKTLVKSNLCLTKIENSVVNQQFPGVVVKSTKNGVLVVFYGGVRGWLSAAHLQQLFGEFTSNIFYEGEVIMPTVKKIEKNSLSLVLDSSTLSKHTTLQVGDYVDGTVTKITKQGLEIQVSSCKVEAFIPVNHLSSSLPLTALLLKTYNIGDVLKNLLCISYRETPILSLREAVEYKKQNITVPKMSELKIGSLVRCSYESSVKSGIIVSVPLIPVPKTLKISLKELPSTDMLNLQPQQAIIAKVTKMDAENKIVQVTAKFEELFLWNCKNYANYFEQYLYDIKRIRSHLLEHNSPLGKLTVGQHVDCVVGDMNEFGCLVSLEDGVQGLVQKMHYPKKLKLKLGQKLTGVILWINYKQEYVDISFKENVINRVNSIQDGAIDRPLNSSVHAEVLTVNDDNVVAIMRNQDANGQLIYLPRHIHENTFGYVLPYEIFSNIKVVISGKVDEKLIGLDKKIIHQLQKMNSSNSVLKATKKRKRKESKSSSNKKICAELNKATTSENGEDDSSADEMNQDDNNELESDDEQAEEENDSENSKQEDNNEESDENNGYDMEDEAQLENQEDSEDSSGNEEEEENAQLENQEDSDDSSVNEEEEENDEVGNENNIVDDTEMMQGNSESENSNNGDGLEEELESEGEDHDNEIVEDDLEDKDTLKNHIQNESEDDSDSAISNETKHSSVFGICHRTGALLGVQNFLSNGDLKKVHFENSSDDDDEEDVMKQKSPSKKKKLTSAERRELARKEEERLRKKEIEIADCTAKPQSEEQFDMLVTGKPNCSKLWAEYIAHCVSNVEIRKARNIAQTALERIDLKEIEERYNIWIVLLNLENNYGDKDSFNKVFEEAVRCNDDLKIYLDVIDILADSQKHDEMTEKIKKVRSKYKHELKMWLSIVRTYYKIGQFKEARNLQNAALKTIDIKAKHIDMIVQFAIMEFQYGEKNHAEALFESVLQSTPKRVDVWCTYVDQVIKKGDVDGARRILERAVAQSVPPKKMKTLFKKYKGLELKYGNTETVDHVIELARKYTGDIKN